MSSTETVKTVKIVSSHKASQGDFVEINASDFDPKIHELFEAEDKPKKLSAKEQKAADAAAAAAAAAKDEDI